MYYAEDDGFKRYLTSCGINEWRIADFHISIFPVCRRIGSGVPFCDHRCRGWCVLLILHMV